MTRDTRLEALADWVQGQIGSAPPLEPVSDDASFRRYFRIQGAGGSLIVMDAPPEKEDNAAFIRVAGLLREAGLRAPEVLARDLDRGFLLITDLGNRSYLEVLDADNADALFGEAVDALIRWQLATRPGALPPYDGALLQKELDLFPEWYVARHLETALTDTERADWNSLCEQLIASAEEQAQVFVHRDYMPRNLMFSSEDAASGPGVPSVPGVIDFQDAVVGPITYDVVSLFRDAFVSWDETRVSGWAQAYWSKARCAGLPVPEDQSEFMRTFDWMGIQRHLKVLGIFARLNYRDHKPHYLEDTPRFLRYVTDIAGRYPQLRRLPDLLRSVQTRSADP